MQFNIEKLSEFQSVTTIDAHTEGEPLRIITDGYPEILGETILDKRAYLTENLDNYRQLLMFEPRGHADMYGALITPPCNPESDFGILFMHNEGYSSMCGHGILAAVTVALQTDAIKPPQAGQSIKIDSPAGLITAYVDTDESKALDEKFTVSFDNVPSFVEALDLQVNTEEFGQVNYDIAFGGAYYAYVDADQLGLDCSPENVQTLIRAGKAIKHAVMQNYNIEHPYEKDLSFLYGTIFYSKNTTNTQSHSRHVCIFADGEVDRSPTGTGVSARAALLAVKENLPAQQDVIIESIVDGHMTVRIQSTTRFADKKAVIPNVSGRAFITGVHNFKLTKHDIFPQGFFLR